VVDDLQQNVEILEAKLCNEGFDTIHAFSGRSALQAAEQQVPDIILLDVMMPQMDGLEVCRRLRANPRTGKIPVILVTALSDSADRLRGLEAGADDFLSKPLRDDVLFARVRSLTRPKR
jgi:two-component system cell cycle response regulator